MNPIIFTFNIRQSVYRQFGLKNYNHIKDYFGIHLLPIVTLNSDGIEQRGAKLSKRVQQILQKLNVQKAHFASYSSSGIDFRYAISEFGIGKYVNTLTTISSPHQGSKLALLSDRKVLKDDLVDPISRLSGISLSTFHQFVPENIKNFNKFIKDDSNIEYYSFGAEKLPNLCSYALSDTGKYLSHKTQVNYQYYNDGVFGYDEVQWGNHITNFEADHGQVIGLYGVKRPLSMKAIQQIASDWEERHKKVVQEKEQQIV